MRKTRYKKRDNFVRTLKALVVDGAVDFREAAEKLLQNAGFEVDTAETGNDGLACAEKARYRIVVCNENLPDIDGCEFCGQLRSVAGYDYVPVLVMTDRDDSKLLKQALLAGATDIFSKLDLTELETYLQRFMQREQRQLSGRVLFIEDSHVLQAIIIDMLTDMGLDVDAYTHGEEAWKAFRNSDYDLVITDIMLEGLMSGITLVRNIRRLQGEYGDIPIIATSGFDNMSRKVELFHLGVNDYVAKPIVREELRQRVFNHVTSYQSIRELRAQQNSLYSLAMLDELTQLFNRHALREFAGKYFSEAYRFDRPLSIAVMDLDHFKEINETLGYAKGDEVLAELGPWLKRFVRDVDLVARWGGEEFIFLLPDCENHIAKELMERLLKRLREIKPANLDVTASVGIASTYDTDTKQTLMSLFELADSAMYIAKMAGRNCVAVYDEKDG